MKKILFAILVVIVTMALAACEKEMPVDSATNDSNVNSEITAETVLNYDNNGDVVKDEAYYLSDLSTKRYDGYDYRILVKKTKTETQYFEEPQEDIVDQAIYERNRQVMDRYGINIVVSESSNNNYDTSALNSILAGDDAYDIILPHSRAAFAYAVQGACYNIHDIKSIHTDKPWWAKNVVRDCTVNGRLFVLDGDISIQGLSGAMCLIFNKEIFDELGFDYPYEMVHDGDWTFDEFAYYAKKGAKDLNGDGVITFEADRLGFATGAWHAPITMIYTGGQKVYTVTDEGDIELNLYSNKTVEIFDEYFSLMKNDACSDKSDISTFVDGRIMFYAGLLGDAQSLRDMDAEFGVLPYPKFDETDEYATIINGAAPMLIIPITVSDPERTGAITEALCAYGSMKVIPAYYEKSLKTKYARDDESEKMMDIVKDSIVFDLGYLAGSQFSSVGYELANSNNHDFASFYKSRENAALKDLEKFKYDYGRIENN